MAVISGGTITCFQQLPSVLALGSALPWGCQGNTSKQHGKVCLLGGPWCGGRAAFPDEGSTAPESQVGVGGFGRTHRHLAQERSCLFLPQMVWARCRLLVPPSPGRSRKMGGKASEQGQLPTGI